MSLSAQMSFSIVAVLILVLAGASAVILGQVDRSEEQLAHRALRVDDMMEEASRSGEEAEQESYDLALHVCEASGSINESELNLRFQAAWNGLIESTYPKSKGPFKVDIDHSAIRLEYLRLASVDGEHSAVLHSSGEMQWGSTAIPAYLFLSGNVTMKVIDGTEFLQTTHSLERPVYLPLPLLQGRMDLIRSACAGEKNEFENIVRYELSALLQSRVLNGQGLSAGASSLGTGGILEDIDVQKAMDLAAVLIQVKDLRTCDPSSYSLMKEWLMSSGIDPLLLERKGELDPADLFLSLNGAKAYDLNQILAQSLYASVDALVLKWLDYLHIIDLLKFMEKAATETAITVSSVLQSLLGEDRIQETIIDWMRNNLRGSGIDESDFRWLNTGDPDTSVFVLPSSIQVTDSFGDLQEYPIGGIEGVDFPSFDLFGAEEWKGFFLDYKRSTFELAEALQNAVKSLAYEIASGTALPTIQLELDPYDDISFEDELMMQVRSVMASSGDWFSEAMEQSTSAFRLKDPMAQSLIRFIKESWTDIFNADESVGTAIDDLAKDMTIEATAGGMGLASSTLGEEAERLASRIKSDDAWGVGQEVRVAFRNSIDPTMQTLIAVFDNLTLDDQPALSTMINRLARGLVPEIPGIQKTMERLLIRMLTDITRFGELRGDRIRAQLNGLDGFLMETSDGRRVREQIQALCPAPFGFKSGIELRIKGPEEYGTGSVDSPNRHVTDPENLTLAPFQSQFELSINGDMEIQITSSASFRDIAGLSVPLTIGGHIGLDVDLTLCTLSGWPLAGVQYSPSATMIKDVEKFFQKIWDGIVGSLQTLLDGFSKAFSFLQNLLSSALSYCMDAIQSFSEFLLSMVETLKDMIDGALSGLLAWFASEVADRLGRMSFNTSIAGIPFKFEFGAPDISLGHSKEYLKVTVSSSTPKALFKVDVRFVDLYKKGWDLIATANLGGEGWRVRADVDPRMFVTDHMIELKGIFSDFVLELKMPEVVQYEKRSFRLSEVPGIGAVLSRIPLPIPGLTASLDAGIEVKYNKPISDHVVINEVEPNPAGVDTNREWIELYNPLNRPVDLTDWSFETSHGVQEIHPLGGQFIGAKSLLVVHLKGQFLDNGGSAGIPLGESVALRDADGKKVDSCPFVTDYYNDGRTWQRSVDGSEAWEFHEGTENLPNGLMLVDRNDIEQLGYKMFDTAAQTSGKMNSSDQGLEWLAELIKRTIEALIEQVITLLSKSLVEMSVFIEVALQDASQTCSGSVRLALVVDGKFVRDALLWIADSVRYALSNIVNPTNVVQKRHNVYEILDDVHIRFGAYGKVGIPRILSPNAVGAFMYGTQIDVNLATFIAPPYGPRNWSVTFGGLFQEVPGRYLKTFFSVDADKLVDCWIMKATVRGLLPEEVLALRD